MDVRESRPRVYESYKHCTPETWESTRDRVKRDASVRACFVSDLHDRFMTLKLPEGAFVYLNTLL